VAAPTRTVRGTVVEHTNSGAHPIAGVPLRVSAVVGVTRTSVAAISGADGSYSVEVIDGAGFVKVQMDPGSVYFAPCPPFSWSRGPLDGFDVHVVSGAILSSTGIPPSFPQSFPHGLPDTVRVLGVVSEEMNGGLLPVSGATVTLVGSGEVAASTLTDANGRYALCWVGNTEVYGRVDASKVGYTSMSTNGAPYWSDWKLDFRLTRR
jgi:hypothetical protein